MIGRGNSWSRRALLLCAFTAASVQAQGIGVGDGQPFHALTFTTGGTWMVVDALNAQLANASFAGLSNDGISYGANGYYAVGRAMLGVDFAQTAYGEEGLSSGRTDALTARQLLGTASYAIIATRRFSLFPTLGVGAGHFDVALRDRSGTAATTTAQPTFAELAQSPGLESIVVGSHLLYSVGGGADYLITRTQADAVGVVFGVRAGFLVAPNRTTWTTGDRTVLAGPDASSGGPFIRVVIGIGGR
jgi:hypothetical protein